MLEARQLNDIHCVVIALPDIVPVFLSDVGKGPISMANYLCSVLGQRYDPVYMSRKIRKFRTDKFDMWNKRKFWLMQLMWTAGSQRFTWVAWVKISVCFTYRIYSFETFEFFCSCIRGQWCSARLARSMGLPPGGRLSFRRLTVGNSRRSLIDRLDFSLVQVEIISKAPGIGNNYRNDHSMRSAYQLTISMVFSLIISMLYNECHATQIGFIN